MTAANTSGSPVDGKLERLLVDLSKLPLFPATAQKVITLAQQENTSLDELCDLLETDVTLATSVLKLANSPLFRLGNPFDRLDRAVVWLGLRECRDVIVAISMRNVFHQADPATKGLCAVLWNHCFLTACLCRRLNRELRLGFNGEEFVAGLLHDVGRILLAIALPSQFPAADPMDFIEASDPLLHETEVIGTDHCMLGSRYAEQNSLPGSTVAAIRHHHGIANDQLAKATDHWRLVGLVAVADHLANYLQRCQDPTTYDLGANPGFASLSRDWSAEKKDGFARSIPSVLTETSDAAARQPRPKATNANRRTAASAQPPQVQKPSFWGSVMSVFRH